MSSFKKKIGAVSQVNNTKKFESLTDLIQDSSGILELDTKDVVKDPNQPRKKFTQDSIDELMERIESLGQLQPILVRPKNSNDQFEIIVEERRWRAISQSKKVKKINAIVFNGDLTELNITLMQLAENNDREDTKLIENAETYKKVVDLVKKQGGTNKDASDVLGVSTAKLSKHLNILNAPEFVVELSSSGKSNDLELLYELSKLAKSNEERAKQIVDEIKEGRLEGVARDAVSNVNKDSASKKESVEVKPKVVKNLDFLKDGDKFLLEIDLGKGKPAVYSLCAELFDQLRKKIENTWKM